MRSLFADIGNTSIIEKCEYTIRRMNWWGKLKEEKRGESKSINKTNWRYRSAEINTYETVHKNSKISELVEGRKGWKGAVHDIYFLIPDAKPSGSGARDQSLIVSISSDTEFQVLINKCCKRVQCALVNNKLGRVCRGSASSCQRKFGQFLTRKVDIFANCGTGQIINKS